MLLRVAIVVVLALTGTIVVLRRRRAAASGPRTESRASLSETCHDLVVEGGSTHGLGGLIATGAGLFLLALVTLPTRVRR
jgi:hypothetical protein